MSNASVPMCRVCASVGEAGWLLRQFERVPYAVLALPLRLPPKMFSKNPRCWFAAARYCGPQLLCASAPITVCRCASRSRLSSGIPG